RIARRLHFLPHLARTFGLEAMTGLQFISTRGQAPACGFADVLLAGLAPDGGLYMPEAWPQIDMAEIASKSYADAAFAILKRFAGGDFTDAELKADIDAAYAGFDDPRIAPLA